MWNPFRRNQSLFEQELAAVKALPEPTSFVLASGGEPAPLIRTNEIGLETERHLAPPAVIDKYPVVIGANITGAYLSSVYRICSSGWRFQYVDLLDELLEHDPDARCVVRARILGVASGRYDVAPARLNESASDADRDLAKQIAERYSLEFDSIPCRTQRIQQLAWADWYGVSALETMWEHRDSNTWSPADLAFIHSRRLNYTDPYSWELFVYDQGMVGPGLVDARTNGVFGLPVSRYPGKFITHTPSLSGQYPTRDGEGRYVGMLMLLTRMITRASAQDFERVIRPWVLGYFNRKTLDGQGMPLADRRDIADLQLALGALGSGSMNSAALPNSVKVELLRASAAMSASEFLSYLNKSKSKALLGQAFTTEPGANGNMETATVADKNTLKTFEYSANALCDTLRRDLAMPWLKLNYPALQRYFCPRHTANVTDLPGANELIEMAKIGTSIGMPIEIADLAERTYLKVVSAGDEATPRTRMMTAKDGPNPPDPNTALVQSPSEYQS